MKNLLIWERERQSAKTLFTPGMCFILTVNSCCAAMKKSFLKTAIISGDLHDWADQMFTTARLSQ